MNATRYRIQTQDIKKQFNGNLLFKDIHFTLETGASLCVTGPNGSGKSTLLKIIAGLLTPTGGAVTYTELDTGTSLREWMNFVGYSGPLINPYDDLTGLENINFALKDNRDGTRTGSLLEKFDLAQYKNKKIKYYSSGMKQRLKMVLALLNDPPILILDEPGTNLDESGKSILYSYLNSIRETKIIILATNDRDEEHLCSGGIRLG